MSLPRLLKTPDLRNQWRMTASCRLWIPGKRREGDEDEKARAPHSSEKSSTPHPAAGDTGRVRDKPKGRRPKERRKGAREGGREGERKEENKEGGKANKETE